MLDSRILGLIFIFSLLSIIVGVVVLLIVIKIIKDQREALLYEVLKFLNLENIGSIIVKYDDVAVVKSRQSLNTYSDIKYLKESGNINRVKNIIEKKLLIKKKLNDFLGNNSFTNRHQYAYVQNKLKDYVDLANAFRVKVTYITVAGNNGGSKFIIINSDCIKDIDNHPEYLMTKGEYSKFVKQQAKDALEDKKQKMYDRVNKIINSANQSRESLTVKSQDKIIEDLVQNLFNNTVINIQKITSTDTDAWATIENLVFTIEKRITDIVKTDTKINEYYKSESFAIVKSTFDSLTQSQKEFNDYIREKAQSISELFGTRIVRNETENEDVFNYIRAYKKSLTPFTAEVSSTVFGSAENDPISYVIKYFYPTKSKYKEHIEKLRLLLEELETLKEAKAIIDNCKKEYEGYLNDVPDFVIQNDEAGFYSRLGFATVDESVLEVEYKFIYTSDGGMAQRSFTVPMNEDTISELINTLESKLSLDSQVKEQRQLMTLKLRSKIKERDNFTCCQCGNSVQAEPNLLLEIDHIIPVSKGGLTQEDNLQTLCWKCNRNKGSKLL